MAWASQSSVSRVRDAPSPLRAASPLVQQPQEAPLPDGLASGDFPPLGAATAAKPSKAEERRQRAAATREQERESSMTFHEPYHAQLRERHNANVRAAEALEAFEGNRERRSRKNMSASDVDNLAEDVIRSLATRGELVTVERVRETLSLKQGRSTHIRLNFRIRIKISLITVNHITNVNILMKSICLAMAFPLTPVKKLKLVFLSLSLS